MFVNIKFNIINLIIQKLSGKVKVNSGEKAASDYYIDYKLNKESTGRMTHKGDTIEFDGNQGLYTKGDVHLSGYYNKKLTCTKTEHTCNEKLQLRVHVPNAIASFGIQDFNLFAPSLPVFSGWILSGVQKDGVTVFGGVQGAVNLTTKTVPSAGVLIGVKDAKHTGFLEFKTTRVETKPKEGETGDPKISWNKKLKATVDGKLNSDLSYFSELETDLVLLKNLIVGGEYNLGNNTKLKAKVSL